MTLNELFQGDIQSAYYDPNADVLNKRELGDTRKKKLTLKDLNKLKKMIAIQRLENLKREDVISLIYGANDDQGGGPGGMNF